MRLLNLILSVLLLSLVLATGSCKKEEACADGQKGIFKNFTGLDGCGWMIELENNKVIEPSNLNEFMIQPEENKKIWVTYESAPLASICMVGEVVYIKCISERN